MYPYSLAENFPYRPGLDLGLKHHYLSNEVLAEMIKTVLNAKHIIMNISYIKNSFKVGIFI